MENNKNEMGYRDCSVTINNNLHQYNWKKRWSIGRFLEANQFVDVRLGRRVSNE